MGDFVQRLLTAAVERGGSGSGGGSLLGSPVRFFPRWGAGRQGGRGNKMFYVFTAK